MRVFQRFPGGFGLVFIVILGLALFFVANRKRKRISRGSQRESAHRGGRGGENRVKERGRGGGGGGDKSGDEEGGGWREERGKGRSAKEGGKEWSGTLESGMRMGVRRERSENEYECDSLSSSVRFGGNSTLQQVIGNTHKRNIKLECHHQKKGGISMTVSWESWDVHLGLE